MSSKKTRNQNLLILGGLAAAGVATVGGYLAWQRYGFGDFQIASIPAGVQITLDGVSVGNAAVTGRISAGTHAISVPDTFVDSASVTWTFSQWADGVASSTRTVTFQPTAPGDGITNLFLATYTSSGGTGGQIPSVINLTGPTANSQFISAKAYKISASCGPIPFLNCCNLRYQAACDWTGSDYEGSLVATGVSDLANNLWYVPNTSPQTFTATVLDTVGRPIPNTSVLFWWDNPVVASPILGYTLYRLSTDNYVNEINLGNASTPFVRTTDANGNASLNLLPLLAPSALANSLNYLGLDYGGNGNETSSCTSIIDGCGPADGSRLPFTTDKSNTGISCPNATTGGFYYCLLRAGVLHDASNPVIDSQLPKLFTQVAAVPLIRNLTGFQITTKLAAKGP